MIMMAVLAVSAVAQNNRIYIEDFEIIPDSGVTVPVILANEDTTCGFQFNMKLPKGLDVKKVRMTDSISNLGYRLEFHNDNGDCVVIVYSMNLICCAPGTREALTIDFCAEDGFKGGTIKLWKCRGAHPDNSSIIMDNVSVAVSVPQRSLIGVPIDQKVEKQQYFDTNMHPAEGSSAGKVATRTKD